MPRYKTGHRREQAELFPARLEDYVDEHNPVRAIDVYVDSLDVEALGFTKKPQKAGVVGAGKKSAAGQPAYAPRCLLKLYLYGYLNRVRSSRALEKECRRNVEVMWLLEGLQPCYKTIADFRKDYSPALRCTHKEFILLCKELALFGGKQAAVDGSFFRGNVSKKSFVTLARLSKQIERLESEIAQWLAQLDETDRDEAGTTSQNDPALAQKLERIKELQARKEEKESQQKHLKELDKTQHSEVDSDARLLSKYGHCIPGYNVQIVTDSLHKLIVTDEVISEPNDLQQLAPMAKSAQAVQGVETMDILADSGYYSAAQIAQCIDAKITPYVTIPEHQSRRKSPERFERGEFQYDAQHDHYICPAEQILRRQGAPRINADSKVQRYISSESDCSACPERHRCLSPKSRCREIWRNEHEELLQQHQQRMNADPDVIRKRSGLVEHPFGTLKRRAGWDHFLVRGLEKVRGEWSLMALAYNFTRVLNILGIEKFKEICTQCRTLPPEQIEAETAGLCHHIYRFLGDLMKNSLDSIISQMSSMPFFRRFMAHYTAAWA